MKKVNVFEKLADLIIEVKKNKGVKRLSLVSAGLLTIMALSIPAVQAGCTYEVDEYGNVTVIPDLPDNPEQTPDNPEQTPDNPEQTPEVIETTDPVEVEPEVREPEAVIYDENGDIYVPQHVTLDDFYAKVEHVEEEYDSVFKGYPDWLRDRYVSLLLERNCLYMDDEDIQTVYKDYLDDFGFNVYLDESADERTKLQDNKNRIPLKEYFIDPILADEADAFETYYDTNGAQETYNVYSKKLEDVDLSDDKIYNSYMEVICYVLDPIINKNEGSVMDNYYSNCYATSTGKMSSVASKATDKLKISYSKLDYVSSHEMKQNTK